MVYEYTTIQKFGVDMFHFKVELYAASRKIHAMGNALVSRTLKHVCYPPILIGFYSQVMSQAHRQDI